MTPNEREAPVLEACPWCGEVPLPTQSSYGYWQIDCNGEHCPVDARVTGETLEDAAERWNCRSPSREAILAEGRRLGLLEALGTHDQHHQYGECACVRCEAIRALISKPGAPEGGADYAWRADTDAGTLTCRPVPAPSPVVPARTGCGICGGPCDASCNCGCHLAAPPTGVPEGGAPDDGMARLLRCEQEDETGRCSRVASVHSHGLNVCAGCYGDHRGDGRLPCPRCPELAAPPPAVPVGDLARELAEALRVLLATDRSGCACAHCVQARALLAKYDATKKEQPASPAVPQEGTQGRGEVDRG